MLFPRALCNARNEIDEQQHHRDNNDNQRGNRIDGRIDALGHRVDQNRDVLYAVARDEVRNDEIVK